MGIQQEIASGGTAQEKRRLPSIRPQRRTEIFHDREVKRAPFHDSDYVASEKDPITNFLGWFSIGLGLAELFAPQKVARFIGLDEEEHSRLLRVYGVRELAAGVGILTRPKPTYWMWNRVIGDTIDLASIKRAMDSNGNDSARLGMAALAVAGVTALDIASSVRLTREVSPAAGEDPGSFRAAESTPEKSVASAVITVNRPIEEVYNFWKDPRNYAGFMDHIESVHPTTGGRSRWKIKAPPGLSLEWDAKVVQDIPNEGIRWASTDESTIENSGMVRFATAPGNRGTIVILEIEYKPKAGMLGAGAMKILKAMPKIQLSNDLRRFKQLIEVGEVVISDASAVSGMHAAQPADRQEMEVQS